MHEHVLVATHRLRYVLTIDIGPSNWLPLFPLPVYRRDRYPAPGLPAKSLGHLLELLQGTRVNPWRAAVDSNCACVAILQRRSWAARLREDIPDNNSTHSQANRNGITMLRELRVGSDPCVAPPSPALAEATRKPLPRRLLISSSTTAHRFPLPRVAFATRCLFILQLPGRSRIRTVCSRSTW